MKYVGILIILLATACGGMQRAYTNFTGDFSYRCSKSGVEYIQSDSGVAIHVDKEGKPVICRQSQLAH